MDIYFTDIAVDIRPLVWFILFVFLFIQWRRKQKLASIFFLLVFGIYLLYALQVTFFPLQISGGYVDAIRQNSSWISDVNLIPFYIPKGYLIRNDLFQFALGQFASNILLTIPFGFGVNFVAKIRRKDLLWLSFVVGFGIELSQFAMNLLLRYPYRVVDITDALLNIVGVLIGYGFFRLFSGFYNAIPSKFCINRNSLLKYIQEVTSRA
jgi:glycopeptide antibiotics resistance protein